MALNPGMVVRIAANLQELKANLIEGRNQIEATTAGMQRLANSFSGDKLIQNAHNVAAAVQQIGGVSKLTEAEQARVNATVEKALAKYQSLGKEAPQALRQLAADTQNVDNSTRGWAKNLDSFLAGAVAGITVKVIELGQQLLMAAVRGFGEFVRRGSEVAGMTAGFTALSGGVAGANDRIGAIRTSTHGLIADFDIMKASNKAMLLGLALNADQMGDLARTATVLGRAMGQDATKSLDDLITALGRSSPMILDNLGLSVKVGEANEAYAAKLGKTSAALTDAEKKQAFMNAAMDAASEKVATIGGLQLTAADRATQLWTITKNLTDAFASWFVQIGPVNGAMEGLVRSMSTWEALLRGGPRAALVSYMQLTGEMPPKVKELAKSWDTAGNAAKALTISETEMDRVSKQLTTTVEKNIEAAKKYNEQLKQFGGGDAIEKSKEMLRVLSDLGGPMKVLPSQLEAMAKQFKAGAEAARTMGDLQLADQYDKLAKTLTPVVQFQQRYNVTIGEFVTLNPSYTAAILEQTSLFEKQADAIRIGVLPNLMNLKTAWVGFKEKVYEDSPDRPIGLMESISSSLESIPDLLTAAFTGGGGISGALKAIGVQLADAITAPILQGLSKVQKTAVSAGATAAAGLGGAAAGGLGATIGGIAGGLGGAALAASAWGTSMAAAGVSGALALGAATMGIGLAAVGVVMLIKHFAGVSKEIKEARKNLSEFQQELLSTLTAAQLVESQGESWAAQVIVVRDAYLALGRSEAEALAAVEGMWDTDNPQRSAAAIAEVSAAFAQLEADNERLTQAMDKYGISVEEMGQKFKQTQINTTAGEFIEDFRVLAGAVDDVNVVLNKMAPEVNEFIATTIKMGGQVPLEMQPIISKMIDMGLLTDENGQKFTELGQIPFAASLTDSLTLIAQKLDELITRIGDTLPRVIKNIPDGRFTVRGNVEMPDLPGGGLPEFAQGSGGMRDFGRGTVAVLHGREEVRTETQKRAAEANGGAGGLDLAAFSSQQTQMFDGVLFRLEHVLPLRIRDAMAGA